MRRWPTGAELRAMLLERADAYCERTGTGRSILSLALVNGPAFLQQVADGKGFTVESWDKCMSGLDRLEDMLGATEGINDGQTTCGEADETERSGGEGTAVPGADRAA